MSQDANTMWCRAVDGRTGEQCRVTVRNDVGSWPQTLGSGPDDGIRIVLTAMPPRALSLTPSGRHLQVTALVPDLVSVRGERLGVGASRRVDLTFEVGSMEITFDHGTGHDDED